MTRLQKGLLFSLAGVLCILVTVLALEVLQPGGYQGLRGLFGAADVPVELNKPEIPTPPSAATPSPPPSEAAAAATPAPAPSLPGEEIMEREIPGAESILPHTPPLVGITQAESAAQILAGIDDVFRFGNFDWRVLERQGALALVISEHAILWLPYHDDPEEVTWATSSIRRELNTAFFESFHQNDRRRILETTVPAASNPWFGVSGGASTVDRIFLLSIEEAVRHFGDSGMLGSRTAPQDWQDRNAWHVDDQYNINRQASSVGQTNVMWWLRSPGFYLTRVAAVSPTGLISVRGDMSPTTPAGVRPAMWVHLGADAPAPSPPALPAPPIAAMPTPTPPILPPRPDAGILRIGDEITFGCHNFVVLDVRERSALILTKNIVMIRPFHNPVEEVTWHESNIRYFLNNEFLHTFTQSEVNRILWTNFERNEIENLDNPWFGTSGGRDDFDLVFLLCIEQVLRYFGDSGFVEAGKNPSARNAIWPNFGAFIWGVHDVYSGNIHNHVLNRRMAADLNNNPRRWWLRNPGFYTTDTVFVDADGTLNINGTVVSNTNIGVRPAMWITF